MQERPTDVGALLRALNQANVNYVLVGGLALVLHGGAYVTFDADLGFARDSANAGALATALDPFHPRPRGMGPSLPFVWDAATIRSSAC